MTGFVSDGFNYQVSEYENVTILVEVKRFSLYFG